MKDFRCPACLRSVDLVPNKPLFKRTKTLLQFNTGNSPFKVAKAAIDRVVTSAVFSKLDNFIYARISLTSDFGNKDYIQNGKGMA